MKKKNRSRNRPKNQRKKKNRSEGIPLEITEGEIEHNEVIDGQIGDYVYTEETEADAEEKLKQK